MSRTLAPLARAVGGAGTLAMEGIPVYLTLGVLAFAGLAVLWLDRSRRRRIARLEAHIETLADQEWERREADAANRAKSRFLAMVSHETARRSTASWA
jgi:signal transduction histidine kinase